MAKSRDKPFNNWESVPLMFGSDICAIILGIPVSTVRKLAKAGDIPAHKVAKNYRYDKNEIRQWVLSQ